MTTSLFPLRKLRYRSFDRLTGRIVTIPTFGAIAETLVDLASKELSIECSLQADEKTMALTLAKYGLLDLTFTCPASLLENDDRLSPTVLRELGFYSHRQRLAAQARGEETDGRDCLEIVLEDMPANACMVKLFLTSETPQDGMKRLMNELASVPEDAEDRVASAILRMAKRIGERFPITLVIEDACLTNSDSVWIAKHEYL